MDLYAKFVFPLLLLLMLYTSTTVMVDMRLEGRRQGRRQDVGEVEPRQQGRRQDVAEVEPVYAGSQHSGHARTRIIHAAILQPSFL